MKIFDGQWRNIGPIRGRGPYTYASYNDGSILGVVDGTLYFVQHLPDARGRNRISRIIALEAVYGNGGKHFDVITLAICCIYAHHSGFQTDFLYISDVLEAAAILTLR